jgi:NAD(P)-dependent dehydrogenase (short-subunit alcohol dehydrogenase family)
MKSGFEKERIEIKCNGKTGGVWMQAKTAIITGASSGFGMLVSLELAKRGFYVLASMRNLEKGLELQTEAKALGVAHNIELWELDVTSDVSIQSLKHHIHKADVLINNAGYASGGFTEEIPLDEFRQQFETNVFGAIAVTQAILPIMRQQKSGTIINMSSISGRIGFPGLSPYAASKHALEGWSESLRLELRPFGIQVVVVEPGSYQTNIWSTGKRVAEASLNSNSPYYTYMKSIESHLERGQSAYGDPREVAKKLADIAGQKQPAFRHPIGKGVRLSLALKHLLTWKRWEQLVLKQLKR